MKKKKVKMNKFKPKDLELNICVCLVLLLFSNLIQAQVYYNEFDTYSVNSINGAATWTQDSTSGEFTYDNGGTNYQRRAIVYSTSSYKSNTGFKLTVNYTTGSVGDTAAHNFSFGLISDDVDLSTYSGFNPFVSDNSVYSIGANLTTDGGVLSRGINFTDATEVITLDQSGTVAQFVTNNSTEVVMEIGQDGVWSYSINGIREASGMISQGFDLSKNYHVVIYGQDDNGGGKSIQSIQLEKRTALGERADWLRGTWGVTWTPSNYQNGNVEDVSIDDFLNQISEVKTISYIQVKLGSSYIYSPVFAAPHQVLESFWYNDGVDRDGNGEPVQNLVVPRWGNGTIAENDPFLDWITKIKAAGLKVQVYVNSSNMLQRYSDSYEDGRIPSPNELPDVTNRWKAYCDANYTTFINSQPYHTGIYNSATGNYVNSEAEFPERKYVFCFAEYILKEYATRYGDLIDAWVFDSGEFMVSNGDDSESGILEEQRLYEAFANAVHAGNENAAVAFNNGPNRHEANAANGTVTPYSHATHFDDFMFGHPYNGGKSIGKDKADYYDTGAYPTNYGRNYAHMLWMQGTGGNVHLYRDSSNPVDEWEFDNKVVGGFYPPMSTTSWQGGATQALEQVDFELWNQVAIDHGGTIIWGTALEIYNLNNANPSLIARDWAIAQIQGADDYFASLYNSGAPVWARTETVLPDATIGESYHHVIRKGEHVWDPEGDDFTVFVLFNPPSWMTVTEDVNNPGDWILGGTPNESTATEYNFRIRARDINSNKGTRAVTLKVNSNSGGSSKKALGNLELKNEETYWVFPNPTSNQVTISLGNNFVMGEQISTRIYDQIGNLVYHRNHIANSSRYSLSLVDLGISSGATYFLEIKSASINKHHKIILK
ncbi:glycoside hydrolase family 107 [Wenyingzhuangia fucanilytica]|uniref:Glycoside hydrolase family 107 n=1 Tax=Wenyingzhuangia fucanilytica TaxID=1790137 RepID=A0A1B1Y5T6_9FLAO|nr:T9SS type A sorting domain-containing protein [Wenyingzhuangia fucanilytica]ANW96098.1 glycoside hydrolase family 107 [Wenyingzhuangia fucanilytica]